MSMHLVECVKDLDLSPSHKLAMVAFADSADTASRLAMPGFEAVQSWSGLARSTTYEVIADLEAAGLIQKASAGRRGRRATWVVFPAGCCELHRESVDAGEDGSTDAVLAALAASGVELTAEQLRALAGDDPAPVVPTDDLGSGALDPNEETADETPGQDAALTDRVQPTGPYDASSVDGSGKGPAQAGPSGELGSSQGPAQTGPLPSFQYFPLTPSEAGGTNCGRHLDKPGTNCRACGTTSRQLAAKTKAAKAAARRERDAAAAAARRERAAATRRATEDVDPALLASIREAARKPTRTFGQRAAS